MQQTEGIKLTQGQRSGSQNCRYNFLYNRFWQQWLEKPSFSSSEVFAGTNPECHSTAPTSNPLHSFIWCHYSKDFSKLDFMIRLSSEGCRFCQAPLHSSLDHWDAQSCLPTLLISNLDATQHFHGYVSMEMHGWSEAWSSLASQPRWVAGCSCGPQHHRVPDITQTLSWQNISISVHQLQLATCIVQWFCPHGPWEGTPLLP